MLARRWLAAGSLGQALQAAESAALEALAGPAQALAAAAARERRAIAPQSRASFHSAGQPLSSGGLREAGKVALQSRVAAGERAKIAPGGRRERGGAARRGGARSAPSARAAPSSESGGEQGWRAGRPPPRASAGRPCPPPLPWLPRRPAQKEEKSAPSPGCDPLSRARAAARARAARARASALGRPLEPRQRRGGRQGRWGWLRGRQRALAREAAAPRLQQRPCPGKPPKSRRSPARPPPGGPGAPAAGLRAPGFFATCLSLALPPARAPAPLRQAALQQSSNLAGSLRGGLRARAPQRQPGSKK